MVLETVAAAERLQTLCSWDAGNAALAALGEAGIARTGGFNSILVGQELVDLDVVGERVAGDGFMADVAKLDLGSAWG